MIERYQRCSRCGDQYLYNSYNREHSTHRCLSCKKVVQEALAKVPVKFECRYRNIQEMGPPLSEITLEQVQGWEADNERDRAQSGALPIQRIWPGLVDLGTGDGQNVREVRGRDKFSHLRFRVSTWRSNPEYAIEVPIAWDCINSRWTGDRW